MNGVAITSAPLISAGVPLGWKLAAVGDLDGDGFSDLLWRETQTGNAAAWLMNGPVVRVTVSAF
jgi:hypothetical protein